MRCINVDWNHTSEITRFQNNRKNIENAMLDWMLHNLCI